MSGKLKALSKAIDELKQRVSPQAVLFAERRGSQPIVPNQTLVPDRIAFSHIPEISDGSKKAIQQANGAKLTSRELLEQMAALLDSQEADQECDD